MTEQSFSMILGTLAGMAILTLLSFGLSGLAREGCARVAGLTLKRRLPAWWGMVLILLVATYAWNMVSLLCFAFLSFLLLREMITMAPTRVADHRVLCWAFFVALPLQYILVYVDWYGLFVVLIPVYAFLIVPTLIASTGQLDNFLERVAKIQWALMLCIYCVSHAAGLLMLDLNGDQQVGALLLMYLIVVVQTRETIREWGRTCCERLDFDTDQRDCFMVRSGLVADGLGVLAGLGMLTILPVSIVQTLGMATAIVLMCRAAEMCHAAIRCDWGEQGERVITCHGAVIDRVFALCFAAPVFFHIVRFFLSDARPVGFID